MYAIIETGGKQVKVEVGSKVYVEKLDVETGSVYTFDKVFDILSMKQSKYTLIDFIDPLLNSRFAVLMLYFITLIIIGKMILKLSNSLINSRVCLFSR